jgi:NAD+ diphosphatase
MTGPKRPDKEDAMPLSFFVNTFAGGALDRRSDLRLDGEWLAARKEDPTSQVLALWNGQPLVQENAGGLQLVQLEAELGLKLAGSDENILFLGMDGETAVFAVDLAGEADPSKGPLEGRGRFHDLRMAGGRLSPEDAGAAAAAKAVFEWKRRHGFCSACGQASGVAEAGWKRVCPACSTEHFPRTDPVTIMLPTFREHALVGRQAAWPKGRYSCLAGFMEPGESIEAACAREVKEEAGLTVVQVRYHSSQPWPFPTNLMIGLIAEVSDQNAAPDQTELEEVRWFSRVELKALMAGEIEGVGVPPPFAIAHQLMKAWAEGR